MPAKLIPCALCQLEAATVFCVNDDANLCATCDASVHAGNPLLARHERRPLSAIACVAGECASAAHNPTPPAAAAPASTDVADVAVVPQFGGFDDHEHDDSPQSAAPAPAPAHQQTAAVAAAPAPAVLPALGAEPLSLYEDSFLARSLTTSDLLDLDADDLELPGCGSTAHMAGPGFACFDPLDDCVVPSFGATPAPAPAPAGGFQQGSFLGQPAYLPPYMKQQQPGQLVPMAGVQAALASAPRPKPFALQQRKQLTDEEAAEAERLRRQRERQRKKRLFGRSVRYQSRRAYAEIRPRIKGRFVTPEEYAVYEAQKGKGADAGSFFGPAGAAPMPSFEEEADAVVPVPTFVA